MKNYNFVPFTAMKLLRNVHIDFIPTKASLIPDINKNPLSMFVDRVLVLRVLKRFAYMIYFSNKIINLVSERIKGFNLYTV